MYPPCQASGSSRRAVPCFDAPTLHAVCIHGHVTIVMLTWSALHYRPAVPHRIALYCCTALQYEKFVKAGAAVFGISSDSPEENAAFAKANNLPYPLLTDPNSILRKVRCGLPAHLGAWAVGGHVGGCGER